MPKLNDFDQVEEAKISDGERRNLEPGAYMCRIQAVRTQWTDSRGNTWTSDDKSYVKLILDIDEGDLAGKFSDEYWEGEDRDWGHTLYMSWSERAYGILKHTFAAFGDANRGFDARAAFDADKWDLFVGKRLRVYWGGEEYERDGEVKLRVRPDRAICADEHPKPRVKTADGDRLDYAEWKERTAYINARSSSTSSPAPYSDVPFS